MIHPSSFVNCFQQGQKHITCSCVYGCYCLSLFLFSLLSFNKLRDAFEGASFSEAISGMDHTALSVLVTVVFYSPFSTPVVFYLTEQQAIGEEGGFLNLGVEMEK